MAGAAASGGPAGASRRGPGLPASEPRASEPRGAGRRASGLAASERQVSGLAQRVFGADFHSPVLLASGTCGYGREYADLIPLAELGGIVTKAVSLEPRPGNPPHRVAETPGGMINAIGLENPGLKGFIDEKMPWLREHMGRAQVFVNVVGHSAEDFAAVVSGLDDEEGFLGYEINVSCPNVKGGTMFGTDEAALAGLVSLLRSRTERPLVIKLTPNVPDVGDCARICEEAGADGLSAINTFPGMVVDIARREPLIGNRSGGVSGPAILPMGVYATWRARQCCQLPIMGIGGIRDAHDALQYILAGACLVQVGTASFVDPDAAVSVHDGLADFLAAQSVARLADLVGSLHRPAAESGATGAAGGMAAVAGAGEPKEAGRSDAARGAEEAGGSDAARRPKSGGGPTVGAGKSR